MISRTKSVGVLKPGEVVEVSENILVSCCSVLRIPARLDRIAKMGLWVVDAVVVKECTLG